MSKQTTVQDPVAEKSGFLKMYMSNHPDTLVGYAKWYGKVKETITSAEMTAIDCNSMTLTCVLKGGSKKTVVVPIVPPLRGYEDVKPRLLEMKAHAQEGLGMIKAPKISTFTVPQRAIIVGLVVLVQFYCGFSPAESTSPVFYLSNFVQEAVGRQLLLGSSYLVLGLHTLESLYTLHLCRKHQTGFLVGALYVATTVFSGFPLWQHLRKRIQDARIESVMKVE